MVASAAAVVVKTAAAVVVKAAAAVVVKAAAAVVVKGCHQIKTNEDDRREWKKKEYDNDMIVLYHVLKHNTNINFLVAFL